MRDNLLNSSMLRPMKPLAIRFGVAFIVTSMRSRVVVFPVGAQNSRYHSRYQSRPMMFSNRIRDQQIQRLDHQLTSPCGASRDNSTSIRSCIPPYGTLHLDIHYLFLELSRICPMASIPSALEYDYGFYITPAHSPSPRLCRNSSSFLSTRGYRNLSASRVL